MLIMGKRKTIIKRKPIAIDRVETIQFSRDELFMIIASLTASASIVVEEIKEIDEMNGEDLIKAGAVLDSLQTLIEKHEFILNNCFILERAEKN